MRVRSLGPNLVFALLMDGPQKANRWPGTYATGLAADPGSSVLTLTSLGLVTKSNETWKALDSKNEPAQTIALWRNSPRASSNQGGTISPAASSEIVELDLDPGSQALVVQLYSEPAQETTMDGRSNSDTMAWYYHSHKQIKIRPKTISDNGWTWITNP